MSGQQLVIPGAVSATGLVLPENLSFEQWQDVCARIGMATKACLWWWGDALNYGEAKWGEMYAQALDASDYEYNTLSNAKQVAARFEITRRRVNLSFAHHEAVAYLAADQADALLDAAESEKQTRDELRRAVRRLRKTSDPSALPPPGYRVIYDPRFRSQESASEVRLARRGNWELVSATRRTQSAPNDLAMPDRVISDELLDSDRWLAPAP